MVGLRKIIHRVYRLVTAVRYRARRRFTRAGLAVLAGLFITGAIGLDMEQTVAAQAFTLLLGFLVLGFACSAFFHFRFSAQRSLPRRHRRPPLSYRSRCATEQRTLKPVWCCWRAWLIRSGVREFVATQTAEKQARSFA